jgi:outer membrane protein
MKKSLFVFLAFISLFNFKTFAQLKIGYVDSQAIMDNLPDAQDAKKRLDALIQTWKKELDDLQSQYKTKSDDYDKRKLIMTDQTRTDMEDDLKKLQQQIEDYREKKFGSGGELYQKEDELMKPVQNKIFNAIQEIAKEKDLDFVFDKSGEVLLLYAKDKFDITRDVLDKLKQE